MGAHASAGGRTHLPLCSWLLAVSVPLAVRVVQKVIVSTAEAKDPVSAQMRQSFSLCLLCKCSSVGQPSFWCVASHSMQDRKAGCQLSEDVVKEVAPAGDDLGNASAE
jgi:hypothetical protein